MRVRDMEIGEVQERFANLVWDHEPIPSGQLVKLCEQELNWKKPTTYTVLRKLCEKGLFRNEDGLVSAVLTREQFASRRSEQFVDNAFHGSLPAFVAAFTAQKGHTSPYVGFSSRFIQRSSVLLPLPEGPIRTILSPFFTRHDTPFSTCSAPKFL